jgi:copper chaperone CopZ
MDENCHVEPVNKIALDSVIRNADNALLTVTGMGCRNCATRVRNALLMLDGVHHAEIFLNFGMAEVYYDGRRISAEALTGAVAGAGNDGRHQYQAEIVSRQSV